MRRGRVSTAWIALVLIVVAVAVLAVRPARGGQVVKGYNCAICGIHPVKGAVSAYVENYRLGLLNTADLTFYPLHLSPEEGEDEGGRSLVSRVNVDGVRMYLEEYPALGRVRVQAVADAEYPPFDGSLLCENCQESVRDTASFPLVLIDFETRELYDFSAGSFVINGVYQVDITENGKERVAVVERIENR